MADTFRVRYRRTFPFPLTTCYAWLTDYQDDDASRTTAIIKERPVVSRSPTKVVLKARVEALGQSGEGLAEVELIPPDRWIARIVDGRGRGSRYEYRLDPVDGGRAARLTVDYHFRARRLRNKLRLLVARPLLMRELDRMWEGFAASMASDMAAVAATETAQASR